MLNWEKTLRKLKMVKLRPPWYRTLSRIRNKKRKLELLLLQILMPYLPKYLKVRIRKRNRKRKIYVVMS